MLFRQFHPPRSQVDGHSIGGHLGIAFYSRYVSTRSLIKLPIQDNFFKGDNGTFETYPCRSIQEGMSIAPQLQYQYWELSNFVYGLK